MIYRRLLAILISVALAGCTSMRPIPAERAELTGLVDAGDHLVVYERSGRIVDMMLVRVEPDRLYGHSTESGTGTVSIAISDIERVDVEKIDGARTTLAVIGTVVVLIPLMAIAFLAQGASGLPSYR